MSKWKDIWSKKTVIEGDSFTLKDLINLDGFDSGGDSFSEAKWLENTSEIAIKMNLTAEDSVFEVGCGCGAFLWALNSIIKPKEIGGLDFSENLVKTARYVFKNNDNFMVSDALDLPTAYKYDYTIAYSVAHYLSFNEVEVVIDKMLDKSRKGVGLFELPDAAFEREAEQFRMRSMGLNSDEYSQKYEGLRHTYFDYSKIKGIADRHGYSIERYNAAGILHGQSQFRFGVIIRK